MRTLSLSLLAAAACSAAVTPPEQIKVPAGFKVELLREAAPGEGSWICMAQDEQGRLYIASQAGSFAKDGAWGGMWRVTLGKSTQSSVRSAQSSKPDDSRNLSTEHWALSTPADRKWDRVQVPVGDAMGMLWAFDSLYVSGMGPQGRGIYRCKSSKGDGNLDTATLFKAIPGGAGEHGAHAIVLGPDKKLYIVNGNSTGILDGLAPDSPYRHWGEDDLLPRLKDPVATFFDKLKAPYGCVYRTDADGTKWELFAGGFRNPYDIAFNPDGELFTYDSDMEWDRGLPWYRPTRILHVVPGGEYGFREGSAKWPAYLPDSLPAVADIGVGCPTGMKFGTDARGWPEKYRRALFLHDWTYGRILAVTLHEKGASYTARNDLASYTYPRDAEANHDVEVFLSGKGMPVTDLEFLHDGSMVFTVGGRGTAAALYRVSYLENGAKPEGGASGRAGFQPAAPGILPGASDVARSPQQDAPAPLNSLEASRAGERKTTSDGPGRIPGPAGETPALPARPRLADADAPRATALPANAPEAQRKLAGGAASEASATTGSPSAKASAPVGAQELPPVSFYGLQGRRLRNAIDGSSSRSTDPQEATLADVVRHEYFERCLEFNDRFALHWMRSEYRKNFEARSGWKVENWLDKALAGFGGETLRVRQLMPDRDEVVLVDVKPDVPKPQTTLPWMLKSARLAYDNTQSKMLDALEFFSLATLPDDLKLLNLRVLELSFARQGRPSEERVKTVMEELLAHYPAAGVAKGAAASGAPPSPAATKPNGEAALPNGARNANARESGAARGATWPARTPALHPPSLPVDAPAWRLNRELCALLVWLSNPELGEQNSALPAKAAGSPWSAAGSESATPLSERNRSGAEQPRTTDKPPTTTPASKGGVALTLATALQGPVPNPGADIFPGRKGAAFHAELGRQVIEKTLALMDAAPSQEEQLWYALCLRWAHGWTPEQRVRYFRWFHEKAARFTGGNSFAKFVEAIRADAAVRVPWPEHALLSQWMRPVASPLPAAALKPRAFVKAWTLPELEAALDKLKDRQPDLARGKELYTQAQCAQCHLFRDAGGNVGPDLTAIAQRFGRHDILEAMTDPSKVVSEQYAMVTLTVLDGKGGTVEVSGLVKEETSATITILTDPLAGTTRNLYKNVVQKTEKAAVSTMPPGLLNTLSAEEVTDLLALFGTQ